MTNPYDKWTCIHITEPSDMSQAFIRDKPKSVTFDTETTGLHIRRDKPFLIQLGWFPKVFTFEPTENLMRSFFRICKSVKWVFGHNVGYDSHMVANLGYEAEVLELTPRLCDTQAIMRLALEARSTRDGGDNLKLKHLGVKYIHPYAANSEELIKKDLKRLNDERVKVLAAALKQFPMEGAFTPTGRQQYWGKLAIEKFMKNIDNDIDDLPEGIKDVWQDWLEEYPEPTYADIDRALMILYAGEDVATTAMLAEYGMTILIARDQLGILELERQSLLPKFKMERTGLRTDMKYLESSRIKMKDYIKMLRIELRALCGEDVTVNQHKRIKEIFNEKFNIELESSDKTEMNLIIKNFDGDTSRLATLINTLRTAEKWYSTYILGVLDNASWNGRAYTQINLNGAISGRMSSNFQQFPKHPFKTLEGVELFHARQSFLVDGGSYSKMMYSDYSQIELRTQAHYTIMIGKPDLNLCRAYMPFKCTHYKTGELYDFLGDENRARWAEKQSEEDSAWLTEEGKPWVPTDLHTMTAHKAYPHIDVNSEEFEKEYRPKGKTTNFASNYGGGPNALVGVLGVSWKEAETLINGYNEAFPGVITYQKAIVKAHLRKGYVMNHYGRRYYLKDNSSAYKLANYVVQGTAADALKKAIIDIDQFLTDFKLETKLVMPIHDEIAYSLFDGEEWIIAQIEDIMVAAFAWCKVPVAVETEETTTNWREAA